MGGSFWHVLFPSLFPPILSWNYFDLNVLASHSHHWFIEMADAVAPGPASAGANSALPRQGGAAALPSSAAPPDYAAGIPTSGRRQIPARSPSRYPLDDADAPHQYRRGSDG